MRGRSGCWRAGRSGAREAIGYTLYYATSFVFTGLAVAVAFHAGLFNIGAEGQAYIGGSRAWRSLCLGRRRLADDAGRRGRRRRGGGLSARPGRSCPAWLQARRGSHVVITTIMFNFIASALMTHLLVNVLIKPGPAIAGDA